MNQSPDRWIGEGGLLDSLLRRHRRPPPGSAPGAMRVSKDAPIPRIDFIRYDEARVEEGRVKEVGELAGLLEGRGVLWVNVTGLGDAKVIQDVGEVFSLHPLALADVVHVDQRAKIEVHESHLHLILRMVGAADHPRHEQLSLFLGKTFVLTFQEREGDCFGLVRERLRKTGGRIRRSGADYLAHALIDAVVDAYFPFLEKLGDQLSELEEEVLGQPKPSHLQALHVLQRKLLVIRRAVWPLRDMLNGLLREDGGDYLTDAVKPYLRDCHDHAIQLMDMVETCRELAVGQRELYVSTLGQRTNEIMKVLTMFAAVFIPLTFIAGIYGMNFDPDHSPWNGPSNRPALFERSQGAGFQRALRSFCNFFLVPCNTHYCAY